jgi:hypothetical protein
MNNESNEKLIELLNLLIKLKELELVEELSLTRICSKNRRNF